MAFSENPLSQNEEIFRWFHGEIGFSIHLHVLCSIKKHILLVRYFFLSVVLVTFHRNKNGECRIFIIGTL